MYLVNMLKTLVKKSTIEVAFSILYPYGSCYWIMSFLKHPEVLLPRKDKQFPGKLINGKQIFTLTLTTVVLQKQEMKLIENLNCAALKVGYN